MTRALSTTIVSAGSVDLTDVDRLGAIPDSVLRGLGLRLRAIGLTPRFLAQLGRVGDRLDDALRAPMRIWNARRAREPAAAVARLFMLHDAVTADEARAALGELAPMTDGGLVEETDRGFVSQFQLALAEDAFCFGDSPGSRGDPVLPICGATLDLVRAALPGRQVNSVLDVGCGAGAVALLLARTARRVVATDVSPRALAFARVNAVLNGVTNVEFRRGDLFEPVKGERYERVAAQPPFIALRDGVAASTFIHGGKRGDELALRLLTGAQSHVAPGGRAIVLADWPLVDGDEIHERVRRACGDASAHVLVLQSPAKNIEDYCTIHAAVEHRELGDDFSRAAIAQREHFYEQGIRGVAFALVVVEPAGTAEGWTSHLAVRHTSDVPISAEAVDRLMAARNLANSRGDELGGARLRLPDGARLVQQPMPNSPDPAIVLHPPAGRPEWPAVFDASSAAILARLAEAPTVFGAARAIARETGAPLEATSFRVAGVARDALLKGALDIAWP